MNKWKADGHNQMGALLPRSVSLGDLLRGLDSNARVLEILVPGATESSIIILLINVIVKHMQPTPDIYIEKTVGSFHSPSHHCSTDGTRISRKTKTESGWIFLLLFPRCKFYPPTKSKHFCQADKCTRGESKSCIQRDKTTHTNKIEGAMRAK